MTHAELVARASRWLRNTMKHVVVLEEIASDGRECPDVIGWKHGGACTVVECKVSRADFQKDRKKSFRTAGGMGEYRWYATPPGLVRLGELPLGWGLVEVGPKLVRRAYYPRRFVLERNVRGETRCLVSAVQRATEGWGRKVFGEINPVAGQLDPHPSVSAALKSYRQDASNARRQRDYALEKLAACEEELSIARRRALPSSQ